MHIKHLVVLLDGSNYAEYAVPIARSICLTTGAQLTLLSAERVPKLSTGEISTDIEATTSIEAGSGDHDIEIGYTDLEKYLHDLSDQLARDHIKVNYAIRTGSASHVTEEFLHQNSIDLVITSTRGKSGEHHWITGGLSQKLIQRIEIPVLLVQCNGNLDTPPTGIERILVSLDGSIFSESVLPYARALAKAFGSELILLTVPQVPEVEDYRAAPDVIEFIRLKAEDNMCNFLSAVARDLGSEGIDVRPIVTGSIPTSTIVSVAEQEKADMVMLTSRVEGGLGWS